MRKVTYSIRLTLLVLTVPLLINSILSAHTTILAIGPPLIDPHGIVLSPDATTLFITDFTANAVFSLPVTGGTPTLIASGPPFEDTRGITISPDGETLFIAGFGGGQIISLPVTGGSPTILASGSPLSHPSDVVVSGDASTLYIADNYAGAVFLLPVTGGIPTVLAAGLPFGTQDRGPTDLSLSPDESTLFVACGFNGIFRLPTTGGTPIAIVSNPPFVCTVLSSLSADGSTLFILDSAKYGAGYGYCGPGPQAIYSLPVTGGVPTLVLAEWPLVAQGFMSASHDGTTLFVADMGFADCYGWGPPGEPGRVFSLSLAPVPPTIEATVDIDPDTLNLKSQGKWITCYIELPEGYDVHNIDVSTIMLNDQVPAEPRPCGIGDYDGDGTADLMVKFNRSAVEGILEVRDEVQIRVTGDLADGTLFEGSDTIRVIDKGGSR